MSKNLKWMKPDPLMWYPISGSTIIYDKPDLGVYQLYKNPNPMDGRIGLQWIGEKFDFGGIGKLYKNGCEDIEDHIVGTWNSDYFKKSKRNLGVVFNGTKGSGKTLFAKKICNDINLPVIVIPYFVPGLQEFIESLDFEAIILIDEAEKIFDDPDSQQVLLRLLDGIGNGRSRKLYILTTNTLDLNDNMLGRPGRIAYIKEFRNVPIETIREYASDNLIDKSKVDMIVKFMDRLKISTMDILRFLVDEYNIHGKLDTRTMNIPISTCVADILFTRRCENPKLAEYISKKAIKRASENKFWSWWNSEISGQDRENFIKLGVSSEDLDSYDDVSEVAYNECDMSETTYSFDIANPEVGETFGLEAGGNLGKVISVSKDGKVYRTTQYGAKTCDKPNGFITVISEFRIPSIYNVY